MKYCLSVCIVTIGLIIGIIHKRPPYLDTQCLLFDLNCPSIDSKVIKQSSKNDINFNLIQKSLKHWIENGEEIATQISIRLKDKEIFNFYAADTIKTKHNFDEKSLCTIFSNTKTFAALFIAIAVDKGWIASYDDAVTKYWSQFPTNKRKYNIKIKDILRHEGGLCIYDRFRIVYDLWNINAATYDIVKRAIEDERITYYEGHKRCYHTISRGHILNEIFHLVEPKHRYMAQYYEQEILPILMKNDAGFGLTFRGLNFVKNFGNTDVYNEERSFDVESPGYLWDLYHVKMAKYILKTPIISDDTLNGIICKYLEDKTLCPKQNMNINRTLFELSLRNVNEMYETGNYNPKTLSQYNRMMIMEHMSVSGLANAHSMTKAYQYILDHVLSNGIKDKLIFNDIDNKFDIALGVNTSFTLGGFGYFPWAGIDWYGWMGWGGSLMIYAPKYDCFIAYTINGFTRKNYLGDPRQSVVMNVIAQQLLKLD